MEIYPGRLSGGSIFGSVFLKLQTPAFPENRGIFGPFLGRGGDVPNGAFFHEGAPGSVFSRQNEIKYTLIKSLGAFDHDHMTGCWDNINPAAFNGFFQFL